MIIPIRTDYRMTRRPWVNYALLGVNIAVFFLGFHTDNPRIDRWMLHPDNPELLQFFTSVFLHGGFMHLAGNMLFLWVFGNAINDKLGHAGYLAFYLAGGVLASVGYLVLSGAAPIIGASGAISAVTGAYLVLLPRTKVTVLMLFFYILTPFEISSLYFLMFQLVWNMVLTLGNMAGPYSGGGIAYAAHSAGYVFGVGLCAALLSLRILPRDAFDLLNLIRARHRRSRYQRMATKGYDPYSPVSSKIHKPDGRWVKSHTVEQVTPDTPAGKELSVRKEISEAFARSNLPAAAKNYLQLVQIADEPILSQQQQLDVANYLMSSEQHAPAADAYERFLKHYRNYEYIADIHLMLGLLYGRYLDQYDRAEQNLRQAIESLSDPKKLELARDDLRNVQQRRQR